MCEEASQLLKGGGYGERKERNWPFLGPPVCHWDDAGS
jgi:hypothetical protein